MRVLRHQLHRQSYGRLRRVPPPPLLRDYKHLLRLRSLLARGRALIGPRNPDVVARLFGGRFDAWATFPHQRLAGVPDPAFWLVMEYWRLGDWRRP